MKSRYLQVTFRKGRAIAAYYYLPGRRGRKSYRTAPAAKGIFVDYSRGGQPIGLEITAPGEVSLNSLNKVLRQLGVDSITREEFAPRRLPKFGNVLPVVTRLYFEERG